MTLGETLGANARDVAESVARDARGVGVGHTTGARLGLAHRQMKRDLAIYFPIDVARTQQRDAEDPLDSLHGPPRLRDRRDGDRAADRFDVPAPSGGLCDEPRSTDR